MLKHVFISVGGVFNRNLVKSLLTAKLVDYVREDNPPIKQH